MKAGETVRYDCNSCHREFEVCLEPKVKQVSRSVQGIPACRVDYCPFCGSRDIGSEDE